VHDYSGVPALKQARWPSSRNTESGHDQS